MSVKTRAVSALRWTAGSQLLGRLVRWSITIYVIRLLEPADYGLMAMAMVLVEFAAVFGDLGLNAALIQGREPDETVIAKVYGAIIASNLALFLVIQATAGLYAGFLRNPAVADILQITAFALLINASASVPSALLKREIEFKTISIVALGQRLVGAVAVLAMAIAGFGVWSLVTGHLVAGAAGAAVVLTLTRFRVKPSFDLGGIARELRFGVNMVGKSVTSIFNRRIDSILIGRLLGAESLGIYSIAGDLARIPPRTLLRPAAAVAFPTIARLREETPERVGELVVLMTAASLFVLVPLCWGAAAVAELLIDVVLGEKWAPAAPILAILAVVVPLRGPFRLLQSALDACGRPDVGLRNLLTIAVCLPPGLALGALGGLRGVALGWALAQLLALALSLRRSLPILRVSGRALLRGAMPALAASASMVGGVLALDAWILGDLQDLLRLLTLVVAGGGLYLAVSMAINRRLVVKMTRLLLAPSAA